jgi:hypothetical protein
VGGLTVFGVSFAPISATEFGTAFVAVMAPWLGREWLKL